MRPSLILLSNHQLTLRQKNEAREQLGVSAILEPPLELRDLWGNVPPDLPALGSYLDPLVEWLVSHGKPGDYVLIQGDFGATYRMVDFAFEKGFIPVYSTTRREATEEVQPDGSVKLTHRFMHCRFREYGV
jgi:hypothetical protein